MIDLFAPPARPMLVPSPHHGAPAHAADGQPHKPKAGMIDQAEYLTLAGAARAVERSTRTIRRWVKDGSLPRSLRLKGRLLIHPDDIDNLYKLASTKDSA